MRPNDPSNDPSLSSKAKKKIIGSRLLEPPASTIDSIQMPLVEKGGTRTSGSSGRNCSKKKLKLVQ